MTMMRYNAKCIQAILIFFLERAPMEEDKIEKGLQNSNSPQWSFQECHDDLVVYTERGQKKNSLSFSRSFFKDISVFQTTIICLERRSEKRGIS